MTRLVQVAAEIQGFLDGKAWRNCIIGGIAVQRWGEPRLTEVRLETLRSASKRKKA
jgi:hypothetical protein